MKKSYLRLLTVIVTLVCSGFVYAGREDFVGKTMSVGENITTLETGKWYFLYNPYTLSYVKEGDGNTLGVTTTAPNGVDAADNVGYLVQLEGSDEEGKYYLRSGLGNYYRNVTTSKNNGTEATIRPASKYTIVSFGTEGHWSMQSNGFYYLQNKNGALLGASAKGSVGSDRDWVFREAILSDISDLTGAAYVKYILNKGGLVRLTNRRAPTRNLSGNGNNAFGAMADEEDLQQVWILNKSDNGYTLRCGASGSYLSPENNFRTTSRTATKLYIQMSPNNSGESSYINISSEENFSGNSCLNLNNDGTTLFKWQCSGDQGSDWTISVATNYTTEEVEENLLAQCGFSEPAEGKYFRIRNIAYDIYMNEEYDSNSINCESKTEDKLSQYWALVPAGSDGKYYLQNLCTERYITRQGGSLSSKYKTQKNKPAAGFTFIRTEDTTTRQYFVIDNGSVGLHCDAGRNVVGWYSSGIAASTWGLEEVELSDEFIQAGRDELNGFATLVQNLGTYKAALTAIFQDNACTQLKKEIQNLSDEELEKNEDFQALNSDMKNMVKKVKNNTWQVYTGSNGYSREFEKFFRVRDDYKVYSDFQKMSWTEYCGMSNSFGKLSGPTGITGKAGDIIYIYVGDEPSADCTLQAEVVLDTESPGDRQTGTTTDLHKGLNAIMLSNSSTLYIFYQLNDPEKYLADYPDMKIHIEGGELQGYWDATRNMTNADWVLLRETLLDKSQVINLKTKRLVFVMDNQLVQNAVGSANEMESLMRVWNTLVQNEEDMMGLEEMEGRFNNIWNCFSINHSYMYASTYGTYYENGTLASIMNYYNMTHTGGGNTWGPSHEMGHNHQASINVVGCTESSNNLFSNINVYLHGASTSRGEILANTFDAFAKNTPWVGRNIWAQAQFFYQLYLYYHVLGNKPDFYPTLFKLMRKDPINKGSWDGSLTADSDGDGVIDVNGGNRSYGKDDYLKLAKKMCDAAGEDLSELFEVYGMFVPVSNYFVGDYSNYFITTTQEDIDEAKAYMHRYPKAGNVMFIDDRIKESPAISGGVLEGVPLGEYRRPISDESCNLIGVNGDVGQYGDFTKSYTTSGYYYSTTTSQGVTTYRMAGTGAVGFKVLDSEGNLVFASNRKSFTMPAEVQERIADGFTIMAAEGNGYDVLVPFAPAMYRGSMKVYYEGDETPHTLYYRGAGKDGVSLISPLPVNSIAYVDAEQNANRQPTEELLQQTGVVGPDGTARNITIDGDKAYYIPTAFTAENLSFTKTGDGYQALNLPFYVNEGFVGTIENGKLIQEIETIPAGKPVVVDGDAGFTCTDAEVSTGTFTTQEEGYVLNTEGNAAVMQRGISPFTYVFDGEFDIDTAIGALTEDSKGNANKEIYDLGGRRLSAANKAGVYIIGGRKAMIK